MNGKFLHREVIKQKWEEECFIWVFGDGYWLCHSMSSHSSETHRETNFRLIDDNVAGNNRRHLEVNWPLSAIIISCIRRYKYNWHRLHLLSQMIFSRSTQRLYWFVYSMQSKCWPPSVLQTVYHPWIRFVLASQQLATTICIHSIL